MTPHFSRVELACKCGCGMLPEQDFMDKVETLRELYGKPLRVTSAARCPEHNARVSATGLNGPHTTGRAIDLAVSGNEALKLLSLALSMPDFNGVGVSQKGDHRSRFLHLDTIPRKTIWSY